MENYKKLLEKAKKAYKNCVTGAEKRRLETIFPELKENEDEMIREEIVDYLKDFIPHNDLDLVRKSKVWIEWLEKQGEQKYVDTDTIKKKAHQIAWETSKHYDPNACKQEWCEMAAIDMASWLEKQGEKIIPEDINEAALQYVDTCAVDGEVTHGNITEPYWNNHSMMNAYKAGWLEKQGESYTKKDIDDAWLKGICDAKRELEKQGETSPIHSNSSNIGKDEQKTEIKYIYPKFRVGDVIEPVKPNGHYVPVRVKYIGEGSYSCESDDRKSYLSFPICHENEYVLTEQKPTWSEEDEEMIDAVIADIQFTQKAHNHEVNQIVYEREIDWLKSLKERFTLNK